MTRMNKESYMKLKKRLRLKTNVKITILEILCLISIMVLYMLSTIVDSMSVRAILWVCIVFVLPSIALVFELYKED